MEQGVTRSLDQLMDMAGANLLLMKKPKLSILGLYKWRSTALIASCSIMVASEYSLIGLHDGIFKKIAPLNE